MTIQASAAREISRLLADLGGPDPVRREAAVARLTIIGARAVERLLAAAASPGSDAPRVAALRALEGIADPRGLAAALPLLAEPGAPESLAVTAIAVVRACLPHVTADREAASIDALAAVALDRRRPEAVRLAARGVLGGLAPDLVAGLGEILAPEPGAAAASSSAAAVPSLTADALPEDPEDVRAALARGPEIPLPVLHKVIEAARARTRHTSPETAAAWQAVRAAAHQVLAARESRLALYDLREALQQAEAPLPVGFLTAVAAVGDESCLEPIAAAWTRSGAGQTWWRDHLADVFRTIVGRERVTRRRGVIRRIVARWPDAAEVLLVSRPSRTRAPTPRRGRT